MRTAMKPDNTDKNGVEALMVGVVGLMIALAATVGSDSATARFFTGVLVGLALVAIGAGLVWTVRRPRGSAR